MAFLAFRGSSLETPPTARDPTQKGPRKAKKDKKAKKSTKNHQKPLFSLGKGNFVFFLSFPKSQKIKFSFGFSRFGGFQGSENLEEPKEHLVFWDVGKDKKNDKISLSLRKTNVFQ